MQHIFLFRQEKGGSTVDVNHSAIVHSITTVGSVVNFRLILYAKKVKKLGYAQPKSELFLNDCYIR